MPRKKLETNDDLRASINYVDQVSARIARLLAELNPPKPGDQAERSAPTE